EGRGGRGGGGRGTGRRGGGGGRRDGRTVGREAKPAGKIRPPPAAPPPPATKSRRVSPEIRGPTSTMAVPATASSNATRVERAGRSFSAKAAPAVIMMGAEQMARSAVSATPVRGTAQK